MSEESDSHRHVTLFNNYLVNLLSIIKGAVPDHKGLIAKSYQKYKKVDRTAYIEHTVAKLQSHIKYIIQEDAFLFSPEYSTEQVKLLSGLDFKVFWSELPPEVQENVWKELQNLYMAGSYAMGIGAKDAGVRIILKNRKAERDLQLEVEKDGDENDEDNDGAEGGGLIENILGRLMSGDGSPTDAGSGDGYNFEDILGEDNILLQITREVGEELSKSDIPQMLGFDPHENVTNPLEALTKLFTQDRHKLESLASIFTEKFQAKIEENQIAEEDLLKGITDVGQKFFEKFHGVEGMPDFSGLQNLDASEFANLTQEEKALKHQEIIQKLTQNMTPEQQQEFTQFTEVMHSAVHPTDQTQPPLAFVKAWDQAKIQHLQSLGGNIVEIPNIEGQCDAEELETLRIGGVVPKGEVHLISCGEGTVVQVPTENWNNFITNCSNQADEIAKFLDKEALDREFAELDKENEM